MEEIDAEDTEFKVGDNVIGTWAMYGVGGMAEYAILSTNLCAPKPAGLSAAEAAALVNSSVHALLVVEAAELQRGDRVLVIGASGGVGSAVVQLARDAGAAYVAAVSSGDAMMKALGVDRVVDRRGERFWEVGEFRADKFDVVFDCAVGVAAWREAPAVVKGRAEGGRWMAVVGNEWAITAHHWWQLPGILLPAFSRQVRSAFGKGPRYHMYLGDVSKEKIGEVCRLVEEGRLKSLLDPASPHPFTEQGVKDAFNLLSKRAGHGKIVVEM